VDIAFALPASTAWLCRTVDKQVEQLHSLAVMHLFVASLKLPTLAAVQCLLLFAHCFHLLAELLF
jgi:hypothetical protein